MIAYICIPNHEADKYRIEMHMNRADCDSLCKDMFRRLTGSLHRNARRQ